MAKKKAQASATYEEAWAPEPPSGDTWTARPWVHPSARVEQGRLVRKRVPRVSHAAFEPRPDRDPIAILERQEADRLPDLLPLRHARMAESPFAYYRGTPAVMAFDLATTPRTDIIVQASGDAHISNFGLFASPERRLVFDANDFDETLPAAWEWDVKRLAASVVIAGRANGFSARQSAKRPWPPCAPTASGWRATRRCASSTCGTRHHRGGHPRRCRADAGPHEGCRRATRPDREPLQQGARPRPAACGGQPHRAPGRQAVLRRAAPGHPAHRDPRRTRGAAPGLRGLPGHDGREPPRVPGAIPLHGLRAQGRWRWQCRDALLRDDPRRPRRERPAHPPGQGGDRVGARGTLRGERLREPWRARRRRPASHAGHARHLPGLDA